MQIRFGFEVENFDDDTYSFVFSYCKSFKFVEMTSNSNLNDVELLVASLLSFNDLDLNSNFVDSLFIPNELALVGGLSFKADDIHIGASCCADFQDWIDVVKNIKEKKSPWMGHDPSPWFEFDGDNTVLWSDDIDEREINNLDYIQFTQQEFERQLIEAKEELKQFLKIVEQWSSENYSIDADKLTLGIKHYLLTKDAGET